MKEVLENDAEMLKKYEKFKLQIALAKDDAVRWCIRPDCDHYIRGVLRIPGSSACVGSLFALIAVAGGTRERPAWS